MRKWIFPETEDWSWRFISARTHHPSAEQGWVTDVDFQTPERVRRFRFDYLVPLKFLMEEFEYIRVTERSNAERNWLVHGKFLIEVIILDTIVETFAVDSFEEVPVP